MIGDLRTKDFLNQKCLALLICCVCIGKKMNKDSSMKNRVLYAFVCTVLMMQFSWSEIRPAKIFGSGMVLQRNEPIKVWGTADAGEKVSVTLASQKQEVVASKDGKWSAVFAPRKESFDPISLKINDLSFDDILIGELWLCSGQSNMAFDLAKIDGSKSVNKENEYLRLCLNSSLRNVAKKGYSKSEIERSNVKDFYQPKWSRSNKGSSNSFSGVGWTFGNALQKKLKVPVGLIEVTMGGSAMDSWLPATVARKHALTKSLYEGNWLKNELAPIAHRDRGEDAMKSVWAKGKGYTIGQYGKTRWMCEPDFLFEAGIAPLKGLKLAGVAWYQGEAETGLDEKLKRSKDLLPLMIRSWREYLEMKELPFLLVQLPGFGRETWPTFREHQRQATLNVAKTYLAVSFDLGSKKNIHPKDKAPIGQRLSHLASHELYGQSGVDLSPSFKAIKTLGDGEYELTFNDLNEGFKSVKGSIPGFELAGANGQFKSVKASLISNNKILLKGIKGATKVRYGWQAFPSPKLLLFSKGGSPLGPFVEAISK